jgi:hypothetical protein
VKVSGADALITYYYNLLGVLCRLQFSEANTRLLHKESNPQSPSSKADHTPTVMSNYISVHMCILNIKITLCTRT